MSKQFCVTKLIGIFVLGWKSTRNLKLKIQLSLKWMYFFSFFGIKRLKQEIEIYMHWILWWKYLTINRWDRVGKAISEYGFGLEIVWSRPEIKKAHQAHRLYGDGIFVLLLRFHRVESTLSATNRAANNASFQSFVARTARLQSANLGFLTLSKFEGKKASHPPVSGPKSLIGKWLPS